MKVTWERIEALRDRTYQRTLQDRVLTIEQALQFVNKVKFCFAFAAKNSELPCLWHAVCGQRQPVFPEHSHSDFAIGLVWEAKDVLAAEKNIYYGKALKSRPSMIALDYFPYFYRLLHPSAEPEQYILDYQKGLLTPAAKKIMDALHEQSPQITSDLKFSSGFGHPSKRYDFDHAMAELQMRLYVVKIAEFYEPFTFLWDLVSNRFHEELKASIKLSAEESQKKILQQYFSVIWVSHAMAIQRLFGWEKGIIVNQLEKMQDAGILAQIPVHEEKNSCYALSGSVAEIMN